MGLFEGLRGLFGGIWQAVVPAPTPPAWIPTFLSPIGYGPNGYENRFMNPDYFATEETALEVGRRLGAVEMFERIAPGNEGPLYTCSELQWWLRWPDNLELNAGILAAFWLRNPEDQFPNVAKSLATEYVALARREKALEAEGAGRDWPSYWGWWRSTYIQRQLVKIQ